MELRVCEGRGDGMLKQHILGAHEIPRFAVGADTLLYDANVLIINLPFEHLVRYGVNDAEGVRFGRHHTVGHTDKDITRTAYMQRVCSRLDALVGCEGIRCFTRSMPLDCNRQIPIG